MDGCERRKRDYVRARDETRGDGTGDAFRLIVWGQIDPLFTPYTLY